MAGRLCTVKLENTRKEAVVAYMKVQFGHLSGCTMKTTEITGQLVLRQENEPNISERKRDALRLRETYGFINLRPSVRLSLSTSG
jgi:hypothetical protein